MMAANRDDHGNQGNDMRTCRTLHVSRIVLSIKSGRRAELTRVETCSEDIIRRRYKSRVLVVLER